MSCSVLFAVKRAVEEARKEAGQSEVLILGKHDLVDNSSCRGHVLSMNFKWLVAEIASPLRVC